MDTVKELAQWSLAFLLIAAGISYALIALVRGQPQLSPPDWLAVAIGTAMGYYFGQRGQAQTIDTMTNGVTRMATTLSTRPSGPPPAEPGNGN